jgi:hypothetical protein
MIIETAQASLHNNPLGFEVHPTLAPTPDQAMEVLVDSIFQVTGAHLYTSGMKKDDVYSRPELVQVMLEKIKKFRAENEMRRKNNVTAFYEDAGQLPPSENEESSGNSNHWVI